MTTEATTETVTATTETTTPVVDTAAVSITAEPVAPDYSALKLPEGYALDAPEIAKLIEHKVPVEALQAHVEALHAAEKAAETARTESWNAQLQKWGEQLKADPDIGGEKLPENLAHAKAWLKSYGNAELNKLLDDTGLANHPLLIKALVKAGKDAAEAPVVKAGTDAAVDPLRAMYPNSPMMFQ